MIFKYQNTKNLTITFFSSLLLLSGCNKEGDSQDHLQKGVEYFNKGDYDKATLELKTSGQSDKNVGETYYYLAMLDEKNHQYKTMAENLKKTLELQPTHSEARLKFGKVELLLGDPDAALEQAEILLTEKKDNFDALALKASIFMRQKKQDEAKKIVDDVLAINPQHIDSLLLSSMISIEKENLEAALVSINTAIKLDEKNLSLRMFKVQLDARSKNIDAIIADYNELITLNPDNQDFKITLAKIYAQSGKKKEAEDLLNSLIIAKPDDIKLKLLLLDFLSVTEADKVQEKVNQFVEQYKKQSKTLLSFADWTINQKKFDSAQKILNQVIALDDNKDDVLNAKMQLAKIAFRQNDFDTVKKITDEILSKNPNHIDAKILQARLLLMKSNYDEAITTLSKILWEKSDSEETRLLLAQTYLVKGDKKQAEKEFTDIVEANPNNLQALMYLYENALAAKDITYAQQLIEKALRFEPDNMMLLEKQVKLDFLAKKWNEAKATVQRIAGNPNPQAKNLATYLDAQLLQNQGNYTKAITLYKSLIVDIPDNYDVLFSLAKCYENLNKKSEMMLLLDNLLLKNSQNVSATKILSELLIIDKKFDKANTLLKNLIDAGHKVPELYELQAKVKLAQSDYKLAIAIYNEGLKENPNNLKLLFPLARIYEVVSDYDAAVHTYETILAIDSNAELAINNLASVLIEHYNSDETLQKAVKLSERFKDSKQSYYKDTYAWAMIKQGDLVAGLKLLKQIIVTAPDDPVFRYHLGVAYYKDKNNGAAIAELKQSLDLAEKNGSFPDVKAAKSLFDEIQKQKQSVF